MFWVWTNYAHDTLTMHNFAFVAHFFYAGSDFHIILSRRPHEWGRGTHECVRYSNLTILARPGSCGDNATSTRSPGRILTKFVFVEAAG